MLALTMNDAAVRLLGLDCGLLPAWLPAGIGPGLEGILAGGIVRRAQVVTWAGSAGDAEGAPAAFSDLTARECADSSFHLEDFVRVGAVIADDAPVITEAGQRTLLAHGLAFISPAAGRPSRDEPAAENAARPEARQSARGGRDV